MPSKVEIWEKAKVGFAPMAVSLLSKVGTVAIWLGCRSAEYTLALDTRKEYRGSNSFQMVRKYCEEIDLPRLGLTLKWD